MSIEDWLMPDDHRFAATEYVVDATHEESFGLWFRWGEHYRIPWEQDSRGWMRQIGAIGKRPIVVSVFWSRIGRALVAFVEMTSQIADYEMMERWEHAAFPCMGTFGRHSDAANVGNILSDIRTRYDEPLGLLDERRRIEAFWQVDAERPYADDGDPQRSLEWAERKSVMWAECAAYWKAKAGGRP